MSKGIVLEARHLTRKFKMANNRMVAAVDHVDLKMYEGKTLGIVGESGCGKSTLMRMLVQLDKPTEGQIIYRGKDITNDKGKNLRENHRRIQMVFQDPMASFNPRMKVAEIVSEPLLNFKLIKKKEKEKEVKRYLEMVDLPEEFMNKYPRNMSGGQRQRVGIARALTLEPEVILCDEATCSLDVSVQDRIIKLLVKLQREKGITIAFICHDVALVQSMAHELAIMYLGNIVERIPGDKVHKEARHPYTKSLIGSIFDVSINRSIAIDPIESEFTRALDLPHGCNFQNRCPHCKKICTVEKPQLTKIDYQHFVACHLYE
ncbi:ABC transporter ATP-binding protein [Alkalibaculum bacchi]|uniref:oligopeptide/dipeptide ABC transporter ATP-binding protein n=1 Tax=Alkalibaculum bacchi TaxID=645887 RepID=UPI0026EEAFEA|nr:ABC transporter ATP-binding protein [Alkalibaculum bacchi]